MADSTKARKSRKPKTPEKPWPDFPLWAHQSGRWGRKFGKTKFRFYGRWGRKVGGVIVLVDDIEASAAEALKEYQRCWPYHSQGQDAPDEDAGETYTVADLANDFLADKKSLTDSGELSAHSFSEYYRTCAVLVQEFGKTRRVDNLLPDDFAKLRQKFAKGCNFVTLKSKVNRARVVFKYAFDSRKIIRPVEYGKSFERPSMTKLREARNQAGPKMFSREELLMILTALEGKSVDVEGKVESVTWPASATMRAMVLLGLNAGFGNTDCANLPQSAINLKSGWVTFPRPKTAIQRRIPLWQETIVAIRQAIAERPVPVDLADADLCFLTAHGTRFVRIQQSKTSENRHVTINSLSRRFEQLLAALQIGQRKGIGFYTLRHVFETIAGGSRDQVAVDSIMGHVDSSMAAAYRETIDDNRLRAVVDHVHEWLFTTSMPAENQ